MDMLNKKLDKSLNDVVKYIVESIEYKKCIELKKKMSSNKELTILIDEIKKLQKKYIRTNDIDIKEELDRKMTKLESIPIYNEYNNNLIQVNQMINYVKDELNGYFYNKLNEI